MIQVPRVQDSVGLEVLDFGNCRVLELRIGLGFIFQDSLRLRGFSGFGFRPSMIVLSVEGRNRHGVVVAFAVSISPAASCERLWVRVRPPA